MHASQIYLGGGIIGMSPLLYRRQRRRPNYYTHSEVVFFLYSLALLNSVAVRPDLQ